MPQSRVSPASSSLERSTTEKQAASSLGSATAYGEAAEPGENGRQGRESARDRTSTSCRARSPTLLLRSTPCSYLPWLTSGNVGGQRIAQPARAPSHTINAERRAATFGRG